MTAPLLSRNLVLYLGSRFCAAAATTMLRAAVAWHVFALTGSAFHLGLIGLVQFVPSFALVLVGGAAADTFDRRRIMVVAQSLALLAAVVLVTAMERGTVHLPLLYAVIVVVSAAGAFDSPARAALLPTLVSRVAFPRAVTIAATNQALAFATGPAAAGVVIAAKGVGAAYAVYAVLLAASIVGLGRLRPERAVAGTRAITVEAIRDGVRFVRRTPVVLGCMTLDMFAVIFASATALLPIYASDILAVGPTGYGVLSSALEVGALATSVVLMALPPLRRAGRALLGAVAAYGVATVVFGLSRTFPLSIAAYVLVGVADQVSVVVRTTAIQLETPDELRGRVSAVSMMFIQASNQLGAAEAGFVAALTSAPFAVVSGGVAALVVVSVVAVTVPQLRRYRIERELHGATT